MTDDELPGGKTPRGVDGHGTPLTPVWLARGRARRRHRLVALVGAALLGGALAWVHWLGLVVAGALVGLASKTLARAVGAAVVVGLLVLVAQVLVSPTMDAGEFVRLSPPAYVTIATALVAPVWGSLVRGVL